MNQPQGDSRALASRRGFANGLRWALCGWEIVRRDPPRWVGMAAIYLIVAVLLRFIPFAGILLVVLLSPAALAGALLALQDPPRPPAGGPMARWVRDPVRLLLQGPNHASRAYPSVLLGILVLGLVVTVFIVEHLLGVGTVTGSLRAAGSGTVPVSALLAGLLVAGALNVLLAMALFHAVHLTILDRRDPLAALAESFRSCARHGAALGGFAGAFLLVYAAIYGGFRVSAWLGYLLLLGLGPWALAALVAGSHCSYQEMYARPSARA